MRYIDRYGLHMSRIGLGTPRFGTRTDEALARYFLDRFLARGGTVVDTARNYYEWTENGRGKSEETIGRWLHAGAKREQVVLVTKGGVRNTGSVFTPNLQRPALLEEVKESMDALGTTIDIYLLHRDEPTRPVGEIMETLQIIKDRTQAKAIGVCNWSLERLTAANDYARLHGYSQIQIVQAWWSIAAYTSTMWNDPTTTYLDPSTRDYIRDNQMIGMAYTAQAKGFFQKADTLGIDGIDDFLRHRIASAENVRRLGEIQQLAKATNRSITSIVLGYITSNATDGIALVSCSTAAQLDDILNECDYPLDDTFIRQIDGM